MTMAKSIASITPGLMSLSLLGNTMTMIPKEFGGKTNSKKGTTTFLKGFTNIAIGVPLIGVTSDMVSTL
uniref:Uncharacterized protein n=1 Tax=viral metagenome TaxID=1070528 RepID=A0A6M3LY12_9ZZZZ